MHVRRCVWVQAVRCIHRKPRHRPQHSTSAVSTTSSFILRTRNIQASGIFGWARGRAARAYTIPPEVLLRWRNLAPEIIEVAVAGFLLKGNCYRRLHSMNQFRVRKIFQDVTEAEELAASPGKEFHRRNDVSILRTLSNYTPLCTWFNFRVLFICISNRSFVYYWT